MAKQNWAARQGLTSGKLALIGVLAAVLLGVVGFQILGALWPSGESVAVERPGAKATPSGLRQPQVEKTAVVKKRRAVHWPTLQIDEVLKHDPFRLPESMQEAQRIAMTLAPAAESPSEQAAETGGKVREATLKRMQLEGAAVVIVGVDGAVALIGNTELRVGDVVDGLKVAKISRMGIDFIEIEPTP